METNKYIIEIPDNTAWLQWVNVSDKEGHIYFDFKYPEDLTPYTEPDLEQVRKEAYEKGQKDLRESCVPQDEEAYGFGYHEGFQQGLGLAWEAAKKIWEYDLTTLREIFGEGIMRMDFFMKFTASKCIEKIREYEQKQEDAGGEGMTEKKVSEVLKNQIACDKEDNCDGYCDECQHHISDEDWIPALNVAISALEFRENYRVFWEEVKAAGKKGKEVEIRQGGRVFKIREVAQ